MRTLDLVRALGGLDLKNIGRDSFLAWVPVLPLLMAGAFRFGVPALEGLLSRQFGLTLQPYHPLLMSFFVLMTATVAGTLVGFMLLDERDDRTLLAMMVTPVPPTLYLIYRLGVPVGLGLVMTILGYPLAGLAPLPLADLTAVALLGSTAGPLLALFLASFAPNKVAGFALVKLQNLILLLPIVGFFLPERWQYLTGLVPTFWPMKAVWLAVEGRGYLPVLLLGALMNGAAIWALLRRFRGVVYR